MDSIITTTKLTEEGLKELKNMTETVSFLRNKFGEYPTSDTVTEIYNLYRKTGSLPLRKILKNLKPSN